MVTSCVESIFLGAPGLQAWESNLLRDCPTSALGSVASFNFSYTNATAGAHFTLGLKARRSCWPPAILPPLQRMAGPLASNHRHLPRR